MSEKRAQKSSNIRGLLVLNVLLLALLAAVTIGGSAEAQNRTRGQYTMVGGGVNGASSSAVHIVDVINQELMSVTFDPNDKQLVGLGYRNIRRDAVLKTGR